MPFLKFVSRCASVAALLSLGACATTDSEAGLAGMDPYEETNREFHEFNVGLDTVLLRPVAQGYDFVTPATIQHLVGNGVSHLTMPVVMINHFLQGDVMAGLRDLGRITLNTVLGAGGLLDPATEFGLPREETDFGVTLGKWGVESGPYLVLPLLGPSTTRDFGGFVVDFAFTPTTYTGVTGSDFLNTASLPLNVLDRVDTRNRNADLIDEVLYESADSYVTLRSIYLQRRRALVASGEDSLDTLPDIFETDGEEEPAREAGPQGNGAN